MGIYIDKNDALGQLIEKQAAILHQKLLQLDVASLDIPYYCKEYFKGSHFRRLTFSIQTSAHLLYNAIQLSGKTPDALTLMDYGAGVGTLYTLAKMIGCSKVIYNDHLADWQHSARQIAGAIGVAVDHYIVGDIGPTLEQLNAAQISCDIILSRNVIEHIYKLDLFYAQVSRLQPDAILYQSTTANAANPGARLQHWFLHRRWEKVYYPKRAALLSRAFPGLQPAEVEQMARLTRGRSWADIEPLAAEYQKNKRFPEPVACGSNTCDPENGVWAEHMISFREHRNLMKAGNYTAGFAPGFWDTHYSSSIKNILGKILNRLISLNHTTGLMLGSFVYIIALPPSQNRKSPK